MARLGWNCARPVDSRGPVGSLALVAKTVGGPANVQLSPNFLAKRTIWGEIMNEPIEDPAAAWRKLEDLVNHLIAEWNAASPEERLPMIAALEDVRPQIELLKEIIQPNRDGSMSDEEVAQWAGELAKQADEQIERLQRGES